MINQSCSFKPLKSHRTRNAEIGPWFVCMACAFSLCLLIHVSLGTQAIPSTAPVFSILGVWGWTSRCEDQPQMFKQPRLCHEFFWWPHGFCCDLGLSPSLHCGGWDPLAAPQMPWPWWQWGGPPAAWRSAIGTLSSGETAKTRLPHLLARIQLQGTLVFQEWAAAWLMSWWWVVWVWKFMKNIVWVCEVCVVVCGSSIFQNFSIPLWCKSLYSLSFPGQLAHQENPWKICDAEVLISSLPPSLATVAAAKRSAWEEFVIELRQAVQVPCWEPWCVDLSGIYGEIVDQMVSHRFILCVFLQAYGQSQFLF